MSTSLSSIKGLLFSHGTSVSIQSTTNGEEIVLSTGGVSLATLGTAAGSILPNAISQDIDHNFLSFGSNLLKLNDAYLTEASIYTPAATSSDLHPPTTLTLKLKWESASWVLIENLLTVKDPEIKAHITGSGSSQKTAIYISGTLIFGGIPLNVSAVIPNMIISGAIAGTTPSGGYPLTPMLSIFGFQSTLLKDVTLKEFRFSVSALSRIFSFDVGVGTTLSIPLPGGNSFELDNIGIQVHHIGGTPSDTDVIVSGQVTIDSEVFNLSIGHDTTGGWSIYGQATFTDPISLTDITDKLLTKFGLSDEVTLPSGFQDLKVTQLSFDYDSSDESFGFTVDLSSAVSVSTVSDGKITTGGTDQQCSSLQIKSAKTDGVRSTKLYIKIAAGLPFKDLLDLQGDLPAALTPTLDEIDLEVDTSPSNNQFTLTTTFTDEGDTYIFKGVYSKETDGSTTTSSFGGNIYSPGGTGLDLQPNVPINIKIKDLFIAKVRIEKTGNPTQTYTVYGSDLSAHIDIDLGTLPVVGEFMSDAKFNFKGLRFVYTKAATIALAKGSKPVACSKPIPNDNLTKINDFLSKIDVAALTTGRSSTANANQSNDDFPLGFSLQGMLILGNNAEKIPLNTNFEDTGTTNVHGKPQSNGSSSVSPQNAKSSSSPTPVGKKFGPVTIKNAGLGLSNGEVEIHFTGGITLGPLTLDFIDFEIKSPVDSFDPSISLEGLGLDIKKPPLTLEGLFMEGVVNVPVQSSPTNAPSPTNLKVENGGTPVPNQSTIDLTSKAAVQVGHSGTPITLTISNQSATDTLKISSITGSGRDFAISSLTTPLSIKPTKSGGSLTITFTPQSKGFKQGGLVIKSDDPTAPEFEISFIANKASNTPVGIQTVPVTAYNGTLSIGYKQYSLAAVGSYAQLPDGAISTFLYGFLGAPMGGPPFFFVTGVAAGFGYNRAFTLPSPETINTFPLIQPVMSPGSTMDFDSMNLLFMPTEGEYWGAVGVRGESFKMVESFVLLDVQFKKDIEIDIIGMSKMHFPKPPADDPNAPALAKINIGLVARIIPEMGIVTINGAFLPGSYVYNPLVHISGGFAVLSVFKDQTSGPWEGAQEGDFVVTLGGYASNYKPKPYYPQVPRLELNWQVSSELSVKAMAYFAITPQAMMAGGDLVANFQIGGTLSVHVNFTVGADFIVYWKPYHYSASFYASLDVTASITLDLWLFTIHASINMDLGADLDIWGPSFSGNGTVYVHVLISFSVHVSFGDAPAAPGPISWNEFSSGLLPQPDKILTTNISNGLVSSQSSATCNVVNAKDLEVVCTTAIPAVPGSATVGGKARSVGAGDTIQLTPSNPHQSGIWVNQDPDIVTLGEAVKTTGVVGVTGLKTGAATLTYTVGSDVQTFIVTVGASFGIKPMAKTVTDLAGSTFDISISNVTNPAKPTPASDHFNVEFTLGNMPAAMWEAVKASGTIPKSNGEHLVQGVITGARITPNPPKAQSPLLATPPEWETIAVPPSEVSGAYVYAATSTMNS